VAPPPRRDKAEHLGIGLDPRVMQGRQRRLKVVRRASTRGRFGMRRYLEGPSWLC